MGILNKLFDEMNSAADEIMNQAFDMKLGKKNHKNNKSSQNQRPITKVYKVYKEIHQHRHYYDLKSFNKK